MNNKSLHNLLSKRITLNLLFWASFILIPILLADHHDKPNIRARIILSVLYAFLIYINNLFLFPRLFDKRKYFFHLISINFLITIVAIIQIKQYGFIHGCDCPHIITISNFSKYFVQTSVFVIAFMAIKIIRDDFNKNEKLEKIEKEQIKTELEILKNQIQPHFLFNVLNSVYSISRNNIAKTPETILKLSDIFRYVLYDSNDKLVPLEKEIKYIKNYVDLQNLRLEGRGQIGLIIKGNLNNHNIAPLLLITFVENCYKHGIDEEIKISISLKVFNNTLFFRTENNYNNTVNIQEKSGVGLKNIKQRLTILYPEKHTLKIEHTDTLFVVDLTIKLI